MSKVKRKKHFIEHEDSAIYGRYSSLAQNDASIEQQFDKCDEYAQKNHLHIVRRYEDRHISGKSDKRPGFQQMMRDAEAGLFHNVIAWKSNRLGRNMLEAMLNDEKLREMGVRCLYVEENFDDTAAGRFALRSMMNVNQFHSENMAEDIERGLMDNAKRCKVNGSIPFGYKRGEDGRLVINDVTAPIVREIFQRIASGEIKASIADDLNQRQVKTKTGGSWGKNSFTSILKNERYTGVYIYSDVRVPGGMPAIINRDLFERAQVVNNATRTKVMSRRRRDFVEYLLTGKLFCGYCLEPMVGTSGTGKLGKMYYYYRCKNQAVEHTCSKKPVRKEKIEAMVTAALKATVTKPENVEWMTDMVMKYRQRLIDESDMGYLEERLQETKGAIKNIMKAIEVGIITESTKARLEELEADQREILANIEEQKRAIPNVTRDIVRFYFEEFKEGDIEDHSYQKMIIRHFLRAVYLFDDHLKIVFDYSDNDDGIDFPISEDDAEASETESSSVRIESAKVYQDVLIRTPAKITMIGRVFVLVFYFDM